MELHKSNAKRFPAYASNRRRIETHAATRRPAQRTTVVRIPVVVHVLHHVPEHDVSIEQIRAQIDVLNADFRAKNADLEKVPSVFRPLIADALIEFELAKRDPSGLPTQGVTRTRLYAPIQLGPTEELDAQIKFSGSGHAAWPADSYLNMWVCELPGLLGYAQFPGGPAATDGVVVNVRAFGTSSPAVAPFDRGRTATHEVGHWLNLLHIWGDDDGDCSGSDNVADTPNQGGPNFEKPTFPRRSCHNGPHGDMFMNYMDYVDDDTMFMFTKGQVRRMDATLAGPRVGLLASQGLRPVELEEVRLGDVDEALLRTGIEREPNGAVTKVFDGVDWIAIARQPDGEPTLRPAIDPGVEGRWYGTYEPDSGSLVFERAVKHLPLTRGGVATLDVGADGRARFVVPGPTDAPEVVAELESIGNPSARLLRATTNGHSRYMLEDIPDGRLRLTLVP